MSGGCVCYLVNHTMEANLDAWKSLSLLEEHYLQRFPAPVVLFHENKLLGGRKNELAACIKSAPVIFAEVDFSQYPVRPSAVGTERPGYHHMCRFFAGPIFQHPALANFDYLWRLDTDSFILKPVEYDLFDYARRTETYYGFLNDAITDNPLYTQGLREVVRRFVVGERMFVGLDQLPEGRVYYTNFEVCYLPWFRAELWQRFFQHIDAAGGIYTYRWGDHAIRYLGVRLFLPPRNIQQLKNIAYEHQGIGANHVA